MHVVGLDIGGANLKAADTEGYAASRAFPLWTDSGRLSAAVSELLAPVSGYRALAVTMTGELADCFSTKADGVACILNQVQQVATVPVWVWNTGAEFVAPELAQEIPSLVAAANWHALATWVGRMVPTGRGLLIDVGSTTTDLIPLRDGVPVSDGFTDRERLLSGELVYTGVRRTPLCAVTPAVPWRDTRCPIAAESFATTLDVYLLLGQIAEDAGDCATANGQPATRAAARVRIARCLCSDLTEIADADCDRIARYVARQQQQQVAAAAVRVLERLGGCESVVLSGSGEFLARSVLAETELSRGGGNLERSVAIESLTTILGRTRAEAACACAVARLAQERLV